MSQFSMAGLSTSVIVDDLQSTASLLHAIEAGKITSVRNARGKGFVWVGTRACEPVWVTKCTMHPPGNTYCMDGVRQYVNFLVPLICRF